MALAVAVSDRLQVTSDTGHIKCDTGMTHDMCHVTQNIFSCIFLSETVRFGISTTFRIRGEIQCLPRMWDIFTMAFACKATPWMPPLSLTNSLIDSLTSN